MTRETTSTEAKRFGSSQPGVASSCGTGETAIRKQPSAESIEINKARKASGAEGNPERDEHVADAGDSG
ncbi:hypothetical protein N7E02_10975 [Aliirhizobium terrae]|uniref:hypothetical protein n=1 Tax=Terrirhizobium terrae TaxID=2926709 RepID=UPI002578A71E|nr:hypothetical protein [Rhizobium sp. CC-CFT758]WJH41020.1 hypothetical protein N7E02_10975 [Rhizobium sp. CC-CFT758]